MDTTNMFIYSLLIAFAGGIIGALVMRAIILKKNMGKSSCQISSSEQKLEHLNLQIGDYFAQTTHLLNNIKQCQNEFSNHIEATAQHLGFTIDTYEPFNSGTDTSALIENKHTANPPLDYSPKKGNIGTLSEGYGLKDYQSVTNK
jgi:uncharacterized membrane-anchored protein YhcB (DUF1043 family)